MGLLFKQFSLVKTCFYLRKFSLFEVDTTSKYHKNVPISLKVSGQRRSKEYIKYSSRNWCSYHEPRWGWILPFIFRPSFRSPVHIPSVIPFLPILLALIPSSVLDASLVSGNLV